MRNLLALIGLIVVCFVGFGWYFGWYTFTVQPGADGKQHIQVDLDSKKMGTDVKKFSTSVENAVENAHQNVDTSKSQPTNPVIPVITLPSQPAQPEQAAPNSLKLPFEIRVPFGQQNPPKNTPKNP